MKPPIPWSRHDRHHHSSIPGADAAARWHHPQDHPGRERFDSPGGDGGGRRHHPPFGGPFGSPFGEGPGPFGEGPGPFRGGPHRGGRGHSRADRAEPGGPRRGRRGGRAARGDVRTALLILLAEEPMHGYQLMQAVADRTGGAWRLSPGAVYPTIAQLEDEGLVQVTAEGGRKLVTLTEAGRALLASLGDVDPFAAFTSGDADGPDLRALLGELMGAAHQLGRVGDAGQLTEAARVLNDARRALYLILAGQPEQSPAGDPEGDNPT
jgi:DNA-binding PadR family transcriptional regulator